MPNWPTNNTPIGDPDLIKYPKEALAETKALRYNTGKAPLSYVPLALMEGVAYVMEFGATKYARDNWKKGFEYNSLLDCALRHIEAFKEGEDLDEESKQNHLAHAATNLGFLLHQIKHGTGTDDRTKGPTG